MELHESGRPLQILSWVSRVFCPSADEGKAQLQGICLLPAVAPLACLMLLRSDGTLGFLCLSSEDLCSAARSAAQAAVASPTVDKRTSQNSKTPLADGEEVEGAKSE